jgi:glycerol-3-phosphate acyltransferase PlsY
MVWIEQLRAANWNQATGISLAAYALGCFATGYYLVRTRMGQDIRTLGSGSIGAKNVGRVLGKTGFLVTLLGDFGKGVFAVWVARHITTDEHLVALGMLAVVAGHIWPAQLRFHGGKGMATSLGALLLFDYRLALGFALLFVCGFALMRKTVLPGLFAIASLPLVSAFLEHDSVKVVLVSILAALVLIAHRKNLMEEFSHLAERRHVRAKPD